MPIEATQLRDAGVPLFDCPKCSAAPFEPFMRGLVQRGSLQMAARWLGYALAQSFRWRDDRARPRYCALICSGCKEIVGWE